MSLSNADNNTPSNKSQDSNYAIVQKLIKRAWQLGLSGAASQLLFYQIDQEFGFIRNGKVKDGDKISHSSRSKHLGLSIRAEIYATQELMGKGVLFVDTEYNGINRYHINRDTNMWIISDKIAYPTK